MIRNFPIPFKKINAQKGSVMFEGHFGRTMQKRKGVCLKEKERKSYHQIIPNEWESYFFLDLKTICSLPDLNVPLT